ncbi:hypothetical protein PENTCL1PPCAC_9216, partial [Pristionchus entomophagus]
QEEEEEEDVVIVGDAVGDGEKEEEVEPIEEYVPGGYHPVAIGDVYNGMYQVIAKLGFGRFSTVWKCKKAHTEQLFALKIVKSAPKFAQPARDEIELLRDVENGDASDPHRNKVVHLYDTFNLTGANGTHICMVFEPLTCNLLKLIIKSDYKGIAIDKVKTISRQILEGLNYLHTKCQIIHTDLKPENILATIVNDEITEVKIADLGNACWIDHKFHPEISTKEYRSPEVLVRVGYSTPTDIWSTACIVYELAVGDYVFEPNDAEDGSYSSDAEHLALIADMFGSLPAAVYRTGSRWNLYFDQRGRLLHRTGFIPCSLSNVLQDDFKWSQENARELSSFLMPMFALNPSGRATAAQCLQHEWLQPRSRRPAPAAAAAAEGEERMEYRLADDIQDLAPFAVYRELGEEEEE